MALKYSRTSMARTLMARLHGCFELVLESLEQNHLAADLGLFKMISFLAHLSKGSRGAYSIGRLRRLSVVRPSSVHNFKRLLL